MADRNVARCYFTPASNITGPEAVLDCMTLWYREWTDIVINIPGTVAFVKCNCAGPHTGTYLEGNAGEDPETADAIMKGPDWNVIPE